MSLRCRFCLDEVVVVMETRTVHLYAFARVRILKEQHFERQREYYGSSSLAPLSGCAQGGYLVDAYGARDV